jgi:putative transposase
VVGAPARREVVRWLCGRGLTERWALTIIGMSASSLRSRSMPDRHVERRQGILALAARSRCYGAGMIYLKVRQLGRTVNHKRVERLYAEAQLPLRRRTRKKVAVGVRQPLGRPEAANAVWSMAFVFDRRAEGRAIKCWTIVDDATHESVAIIPERTSSGECVTRILDALAATRGLPQMIRTDNGKDLCGRGMLTWAQIHNVKLRLIEPGTPNQNAYVESFTGRFRDECLNTHWVLNLARAQSLIEAWRREYNEERPKKA